MPPAQANAPQQPPLICIVNAASQTGVDLERLSAAGVRVRIGTTSGCDLLFSRAGVTLAFLLLGGAGSSDGAGGASARVEQLARTFKHGFVLLPFEAQAAAAAPLAARYGAEPGLSFVFMPMMANATAQALAIAQAVMSAMAAEEGPWRTHQEAVVATADAVTLALQGLPLPPDVDRAHTSNLLRMLGSIRHISQQGAAELAAHTDLPPAAAQQLAAFFRRSAGSWQRDEPQPVRPLLRSL